ncbi:MAG: VRR-NUC domain-containing protein [Puniceicoccales bacterium]|jgi:hypothetical protein|nr:VRR-NUC domain-containing protein [Puniceicoccales bacterium]
MDCAHWKEIDHQKAVFSWADEQITLGRKELLLLGSFYNEVSRLSRFARANRKALGFRKGIPDLYLLIPRGNYHGLFIELKSLCPTHRRAASSCQGDFAKLLMLNGYRWTTCHGFENAIAEIERYLRHK